MEYNKLYEKYKPMMDRITIKYTSIANKYGLEAEDLKQICAVALWKASKIDSKSLTIPLEAYIYKSMEFALRKEIEKLRKKHMSCISLQLLASQDDGNTTLQDTLVDEDVDIEASVEEKLMMIYYKNEIRTKLDENNANILIDKYFNECVGIKHKDVSKARRKLLRRSFIFREEFFKLKGIKLDFSLYD